ncbi:hypothetical protein P7K49_003237, partial [Saguinus oedipus]
TQERPHLWLDLTQGLYLKVTDVLVSKCCPRNALPAKAAEKAVYPMLPPQGSGTSIRLGPWSMV